MSRKEQVSLMFCTLAETLLPESQWKTTALTLDLSFLNMVLKDSTAGSLLKDDQLSL
jgi:hypothetical protein